MSARLIKVWLFWVVWGGPVDYWMKLLSNKTRQIIFVLSYSVSESVKKGSSRDTSISNKLHSIQKFEPPRGQPCPVQLWLPCPAQGFAAALVQPHLRDVRGQFGPVMTIFLSYSSVVCLLHTSSMKTTKPLSLLASILMAALVISSRLGSSTSACSPLYPSWVWYTVN